MKPKNDTRIPHGLIVCDKPLTPELVAELKRVLEVELVRKPHRYSMSVLTGDCDNCSLIKDRKALWFIAGIGMGTLVAAAAFVALVLWMV